MKNSVLLHGKSPGCGPFPALTYLYFEKQPTMPLFTTLPTPFQKRSNAFPFLLFFWFLASMSQAQTIRYVKSTATGTGDGLSWANVSADLQGMINASGTDQVWVAADTYRPTTDESGNASPTDPRTKTFEMKADVKIYGSFASTEATLSERILAPLPGSILSGDLNNDDATTGNGENSYHVICNFDNGLTTINSQNSKLI